MFAAILLIISLLLLALVYGIFFLLFKLGWMLFGKKGNRWPFILAGLSTLLLIALLFISTWVGINKFVVPVQELLNKTLQKTEITTGVRPYTDPKYGFTMNLYGGTETSDWITFDANSLLIGFDTNFGPIYKKIKQQNPNGQAQAPMSGLIILVQAQKEPIEDVQEMLQEQADSFLTNQNEQIHFISSPDYSVPNTVFQEADIQSQQGIIKAYIVSSVQDNLVYLVAGFGIGNDAYLQLLKDEIRSFRPEGMPPAPLPYNTPFTVPNKEVPAITLPAPAK